mgnify:CR=1
MIQSLTIIATCFTTTVPVLYLTTITIVAEMPSDEILGEETLGSKHDCPYKDSETLGPIDLFFE